MMRRDLLAALATAGLSGCARKPVSTLTTPTPLPFDTPRIFPIRAETGRIFRVTVCLRPFRAAGPRLDVERVGDKTVVHNYGHGGSGWSLSWGSGAVVTEKALATGERDIAVLGCGALGLTAAIVLQRAGARVTIYSKDRPPEVRSSRATGSFTPDSRIALSNAVSPDFPALWEKMCRQSFHMFESFLGSPGNPVEWTDRYNLSDTPLAPAGTARTQSEGLPFARYSDRIADLSAASRDLPPGTHPFPTRYARRTSGLTFNVASYSRQLTNDFFTEGGHIEYAEFHTPSELSRLPQKTIVNSTGYGARALWKDESIVPVRGQIAWLIPQPEVGYGVHYRNLYLLGHRDGIVVQDVGSSDMFGYNDSNETPDPAAAEASVKAAAELFKGR